MTTNALGIDRDTRDTRGIPTLAVLPFKAVGSDDETALIAAGLSADICGELTRFRSLRVISAASSAHMAEASDAELGAQLGVSHVVRGRLRMSADGARSLAADLSSVSTLAQLWSERFALPSGDPSDVGEAIVGRIAATLSARIDDAMRAETRRRRASGLEAWELTLRGLILVREGTREA